MHTDTPLGEEALVQDKRTDRERGGRKQGEVERERQRRCEKEREKERGGDKGVEGEMPREWRARG
jgi:hypothetical protein